MGSIYLDNAATTPVRPEVRAAMEPYLGYEDGFGNPSSIHAYGQAAKAALDEARDTLGAAIGAEPSEITFTSGGTEADNLAVVGLMTARRSKGSHFITTTIEHEAVLRTAAFLEKFGYQVSYVDVDTYGQVDPDAIAAAIRPETTLISVMHANNEVGSLQPVAEIGELARERGILFHTDAVQSFGQLPVNADDLNADAISLSSHKIYGPKGVGALYVRRGAPIEAILHGGGQERDRRSGTENVPGIVGFAAATSLLLQERGEVAARMRVLRDDFIAQATARIPGASLNGHPTERLPNNINISIPGIEGEAMLLNLDIAGIAASAGSACASGSIEPSHVLLAMGISPDRVRSALRLTLGRGTTQADLDYTLETLLRTTRRLHEMTGHNIGRL